MRILIFTNHFYPENFRINDLAFSLAERGNEVTVLTGLPNYPEGKIFPGYGFFKNRSETVRGVHIERIPLIPRGSGSGLRLILNYLSSLLFFCLLTPFLCRKRFDVIFVFETSPITIGLPAILVRWIQRIPIVFWVLDLWPESLSATGAIKNRWILGGAERLVRFIYRRCERILISSRGFEKSIRKIGGYAGELVYFPNWIEPEMLSTSNSPGNLPNLPAGFRIVFTGNIGVAQDFESIMTAADKLRDHYDIHWIIVGSGRQQEWVEAEIEKRKLQSNVHMMGRFPIEAMPYFYSNADALLLPLRKEPIFELTVPGKLQSYMAAGRPILAALDGEGAALVEESKCGIACAASDPQRLADAVLQLKNMSLADRQTMGELGRQFCMQQFDRETLFARLIEVLKTVTATNQ